MKGTKKKGKRKMAQKTCPNPSCGGKMAIRNLVCPFCKFKIENKSHKRKSEIIKHISDFDLLTLENMNKCKILEIKNFCLETLSRVGNFFDIFVQ